MLHEEMNLSWVGVAVPQDYARAVVQCLSVRCGHMAPGRVRHRRQRTRCVGIRRHSVHLQRALGRLPGEWAGLEEKAGFEELMHEDIGWVWNTVEAAGDLVDSLERSGGLGLPTTPPPCPRGLPILGSADWSAVDFVWVHLWAPAGPRPLQSLEQACEQGKHLEISRLAVRKRGSGSTWEPLREALTAVQRACHETPGQGL